MQQSPDRLPPWVWPRAAYVHVPFCAHHCNYCDFAVVSGRDAEIDLYVEALGAELARLGEPQPVHSIFLGGGTPTHLRPEQLGRLLPVIRHWLSLEEDGEFSVEANPGTLDPDKIAVLADHGVTRVSLGSQSFNPAVLRVLERDHGPDDIARAVGQARRRIAEVSLDLIFGVPGQSRADWHADLAGALALRPDHVSTYGLTYEKGTRLWKQRRRGELAHLDEDTELAMYAAALDTLGEAGFEHYEISNFARPGKQSRHNQVYWANEAYWGFGLGAARYVRGRREVNTRDLDRYLRHTLSGEPATFQSEELPPEERARETAAVQLRRSEGIGRARFREQTGYALDDLTGPALQRHRALGLLEDDGHRVYLTRRGKYVADALVQDLWR